MNICALAAFAVCCGLVYVSAQQTQSAQQSRTQQKRGDKTKPGGAKQDNTDHGQIKWVTVNVRLPVTVTDKNNGFVVDLKETDFEIVEGKTTQTIVSLLPQSNLPHDVAMLIDTSNSVKPKLYVETGASGQVLGFVPNRLILVTDIDIFLRHRLLKLLVVFHDIVNTFLVEACLTTSLTIVSPWVDA